MRIEFRPQSLVKNIVTESLSKDGNTLNRLIEIPTSKYSKGKVLDITYKKNEFLPTQWYVSNYNLYRRNNNGVTQTLVTKNINPQKSRTVVKKYTANGYGTERIIDNSNGKIKTKSKNIRP